MIKSPRIGLYGGSFDPIHHGHIHLALQLKEHHQLDEVWFCPTATSPHKIGSTAAPPHHRLEMTRLAVADIAGFKVIDNEIKRQGISYTIDTVQELLEEEVGALFLLVSDEASASFHKWRQCEEIVQLVTLLVGSRCPGHHPIDLSGKAVIDEAIKRGMTPMDVLEISATSIRHRLSLREYCKHLVPPSVVGYIIQKGLYLDQS